MKKVDILYEPLPIGRIGVRKDDQEVFIAQDFSCFGQMLEEYISFGAVHIILPCSSPEITMLDEMPLLLKKRIKIVNDDKEIETVNRLLFELRKEFEVKINEENNILTFSNNTPRQLNGSISQLHTDVKKLALGFNQNIHVIINSEQSIESLRYLRTKSQNQISKIVLAQLEAILNQYKNVKFEALNTPKEDTPYELISIFDKLINDQHYLEYSNAITELSSPSKGENVSLKIRELIRLIRSKNYIGDGWDFIVKIIKIWPGIPLPESKAISSLIVSNEFPPFINMDIAQKRAVDMWRNSNLTNKPLRRDGLPIADENIIWLPPLESMKIGRINNMQFTLGTVGELKKALENIKTT